MFNRVMILGKPNVGKSTLFNMLVGKKIAIEDNSPGLTRDLKKESIEVFEKKCVIIDSPGISEPQNLIEKRIQEKNKNYIEKCILLILVLDGKTQLTLEDHQVIKKIRKSGKEILIVLNKCEGKVDINIIRDCEGLGFGKPLMISATHNQGIDELKFIISSKIPSIINSDSDDQFDISIAIIGKTNSGKSSVINVLSGKETAITGDIPNLTRDSVETLITKNNLSFKIIDTAGFNKARTKKNSIEKLSIAITKKKIRLSKFVFVVIDIENFFEKLHSKIIRLVNEENRCMFLLINKIDKVANFSKEYITDRIYKLNPQVNGVPVFFISAKEKIGFEIIINEIQSRMNLWGQRISTGRLNSWLKTIMKNTPPPLHKGNIVKFKFITQIKVAPPKFNIFMNFPIALNPTYKRFLENDLKKKFNMEGFPIKVIYKKSNNPFNEK